MSNQDLRPQVTRGQVLMRDVYRAGWAAGPLLLRPGFVRGALASLAGKYGQRLTGKHCEQWRENVRLATGQTPSDADTELAVRSWMRVFTESFVLPSWSKERIVSTVTTDSDPEMKLREAMATRGAVVALPHLGSWDHAGAWACATGMPVATVAEEFGDAEFKAFKRYREKLGMRIYSHKDQTVLASLTRDLAQGHLVCLVADRVFDGKGIPVVWPDGGNGRAALAPVGPALLARRTGAYLVGAAARYNKDGIHLVFSQPVEHREGADGLRAMSQDLVNFFAAEVSQNPTDWHVFVPFFPESAKALP